MHYKTITVPEESAALLHVRDDIAGLGLDDYVVEKIGKPFMNANGTRMVELTLVRRSSALQQKGKAK
jgi:hypothetical protein